MKRALMNPIQHCRPVPAYTDGKGVYLMDDFGNAVYLPPGSLVMGQWAAALVDACMRVH